MQLCTSKALNELCLSKDKHCGEMRGSIYNITGLKDPSTSRVETKIVKICQAYVCDRSPRRHLTSGWTKLVTFSIG